MRRVSAKTMQIRKIAGKGRVPSLGLDDSGVTLVEVMIGSVLGGILLLGMASFFVYQNRSMKALRTLQSRDALVANILRSLGNTAILNATANFAGSGGWPTNSTGVGVFKDCWLGGGTNSCTHGTEAGITLVDSAGAVIAGPGSNAGLRYDGVTAVYGADGRFCGGTGDTPAVNPDPTLCPFVVYTTFTPICGGGSCATGIAAEAVKFNVYVRQGNTANSFNIEGGGRVKPMVSSLVVSRSDYGGSFAVRACPAGMVRVGTGRGAYCIETTTRPAKTWANAVKECGGVGYSLCTYDQFVGPCSSGAITHGTTDEWSGEAIGGGQAVTLNGDTGTCTSNHCTLVTASLIFRCCMR
jgi:Tfp pilus assembly protein PilV